MVSSIRRAWPERPVEWTPRRESLDACAFDCGRVGPYALGPEVRDGPFGAVHLAVGAQFDVVLELERVEVDELDPDPYDSPGTRVLDRLNHCVGLRHPHVATLLGAGLDGGAPYLLRGHVLGRTLGDLERDGFAPPPDVATGIVYALADALGFLAEAGPQPGTCSLGGVDGHAVFLGWDGTIQVHGAGLAVLRRPESAPAGADADFAGLGTLAARLVPELGGLVEEAGGFPDACTRIRRWRRECCAERRERTGDWLRQVDPEGCAAYRRFFALEALS